MKEVEKKAYELFAAISKIEVAILFKSEVTNAKIVELTTLLNDYNEALKKEKDGK